MSQFWKTHQSVAEQLMDAADTHSRHTVSRERRTSNRTSWRVRLKTSITHPGGSSAEHEVLTRDISATGVCFVHAGFLHVGTICTLQLMTHDNAWIDTVATVVHCRHLGGRLHEVGACFDQRIDIMQILPIELAGTVLLVEDIKAMAKLITHHLEKGGLDVVIAASGEEALALANHQSFDLILMDEVLPDTFGHQVIEQLRQQNMTMPIISLTASTDDETRRLCQQAGCDSFLSKPIDSQSLLDYISAFLDSDQQLTSAFADDPDMAEYIEDFVRELPNRVKSLHTAIIDQDSRKASMIASELNVLASASGGCGFPSLSSTASHIEHTLTIEPTDWTHVLDLLSQLEKLAARVRIPSAIHH